MAPAAEDLDRHHKFGYDIVRQMGELGLFGLPFAEEAGGAGADFLSLCLAIEEISRADAGVGITLEAAVCLGAAPIYDFGTKEQKERWLPDLLARPQAVVVRPDRARGGLRRRRDEDASRARVTASGSSTAPSSSSPTAAPTSRPA